MRKTVVKRLRKAFVQEYPHTPKNIWRAIKRAYNKGFKTI